MSSDWQPVRKDRSKHQNRAQVSIYADGNGHINARGDDLLGNPDRVRLLTNPDEGLLRIDPVDEDHLDGYSFSRDEREGHTGRGGDVNFKRTLAQLGADIESFDGTTVFEIEERDGFYVVDLSELPGVGEEEADDEPVCNLCGHPPHDHDPAGRCPGSDDFGESPDYTKDADVDQEDDVAFDETVKVDEEFQPDDSPLTDVPGVGPTKAQALESAGYGTEAQIRAATEEELADLDAIGSTLAARIKSYVGDSTDPAPDDLHDAIEAVESVQELAEELDARGGRRSPAGDERRGVYHAGRQRRPARCGQGGGVMDRHKRHLQAADDAGDGDELYVYVRDSRDGRSYRIEFKANIMGEYKLNGGGGFRPAREDVFEAAKEIARTHVTAELGHPVVSRQDWTWVKESTAAKILEESDAYTVDAADGGEE